MAIGNHNDLTHIVRTSDQWKNTYDKYELIPTGVLCVELVSSDVTKIKIGDGHNIFSKLPYIGDLDLSKYYTKLETDTRIKEILTQEKVVRIKGLIGSKSDLPADARCGDIYFVRQLSSSDNKYIEYIYSPDNTWEPLGGIPVDIDLSEYAKTAYVDDKIEQVNERIDDIEQHGTHTHPNKEILDQITEPYTTADKETLASLHNYDDTEIREMISQSSHTHANKDILDATSAAFTKEDKSKLDQLNPYDDSILKEKITALERLAHEHSNKRILDRTTASFTTEYERKMRWIRIYTGCTGMEEGIAGLVPAAQAGEEDYVLSGSGEWVPQTGGGGTYELPIATTTTLGGIKVGDGLEIDANGKLSVVGGGGGGDTVEAGDGIDITTDSQTGNKVISIDTGNGLQINQDGELEIDPSVLPSETEYRPGKAIEFEHNSSHLSLTDFSNTDFIASITRANAGTFVKAADNSTITLTASGTDCYTVGIGGDGSASGSYAYNVKANTQYRLMWDSSDTTVPGNMMVFENAGYTNVYVEDQSETSFIDFTTSSACTFITTRLGVSNAGDSVTFSNVRLYEYVEDTFEYDDISVKYNNGLTVNSNNELEVVLSKGLEFDPNATETMVADEMYLFASNVSCQVHTDNPLYSVPANRTYQKTTTEPALCCLWEVGDSGSLWTGPLIVGLTPTSVQYTAQDTQQTVNYQNTFTYLDKTWYTSGYPDFLNNADHEDKLGNLQYLGSYAAVSDQIQAAKDLIDLANVQFVSNAGIQAKLGNGLQFDANGAIEAVGGGETYDAGDGIEIAEVTHEDEFRVQNQEYFFTDHGLTCILTGNYGPRTFTKINDGDIVAAVIGTTGGWYMPLFVGLTEDSVKYSNSYDSNILGPTGSFTYHDKTWYYTADYALTAGDGVDHAGHLQSMTDTIYDGTEGKIQAAKDLIDLAVLLSDVSTPTINAKIGAGLSFDANGAIQADAQPLSPATDSTLGGVIVGDGILVDNDGTISVDPTIIPEVTEYEAGTAISIEDVEHGGVIFDAWDSGTGWENVCYSNSTGDSVVNYPWEAHSPISNSYTLPAGATKIRAISYDQNDTMLWTSFSWIDSNNYHFASTSSEDGYYDDWFDIPTGAVKVNFGVRHSKLNTTTAMSLNDIKSVDITVQTVSEIEVDVWNGGTGWLNGNYYSGNSDTFTTSWYYSYHSNPDAYIPIPNGATHVMVMGISNENDSHFEGGGVNVFSAESHSNHIYWWSCAWEWHEISSDAKFVQIDVKWNNNTRTISAADIKSVTLAWKLPALEINQAINVKYGDGLTVNQNNELEVNLGSGLQFDANGAIEVVGGGSSGGNGDYTAGDAIEFRSTQLSFNVDAIRWDISNIKSTSQTSGPWTQVRYIEFCDDTDTPYTISSASGIWEDNTSITYSTTGGSQTINDMIANTRKMCAIWRYPDHTMQLTFNLDTAVPCADIAKFRIKLGDDAPERDPKSWKVYFRDAATQIWYIVQDITNAELSDTRDIWSNYYPFDITGATSINVKYGTGLAIDPITGELFVDGQLPEGTIIKKLTYVGDGSGSSNVIKFTKKPLGILSINGSSGTNYISAIPASINSEYLHGVYGGVNTNGMSCSCRMSYNDATNELTLTQAYNGNNDSGLIYNANNRTYTIQYLVKGHTGSGTSENNEVSVVKTFSYVGTGTSTNNIQFPETPDMILDIHGPLGVNGDIITSPMDIKHPSATSQYTLTYSYQGGGHVHMGSYSFNDTTNVLTLTGNDYGACMNYDGYTYYVDYIVNEVISSSIGGGTNYIPGEGIEFTELTSSVYADKVRMEITGIKSYSQSGSYAPYVQMRYLEFSDENHDEITLTSGTGIWDDGTPVEYPNPGESIDVMIAEMIANTGKMIATKFDGTKSLILTFDLSEPVLYDDLQYLRYKTGNDAPERDPISWKIYFNNTNSVNNWNLAAVVDSATITNNREEWTQYFPLTVNEFNSVVISATGGSGSGDTVAEGNGISITTDQQTGEKVISVNIGTGLQINQTTHELEPKLGDGLELDEYNAITVDPFYPNTLILNCVLDDEPSSDLILHFTLDSDE